MFRPFLATLLVAVLASPAAASEWRTPVVIHGQPASGSAGPALALPDGSFVELGGTSELTRYSAAGTVVWRRRSFERIFGQAIDPAGDGDVFVLGNTRDGRPHVARVAPDGSLRWSIERPIGFGNTYRGADAGTSYHLSEDAGLTRLRADGTVAWNLAAVSAGRPYDVGVAQNGDAIVCPRDAGALVRRITPTGATAWSAPTPLQTYACAVESDGSVTLAGSDGPGFVRLVHYTSLGQNNWSGTATGVDAVRLVALPAGGFLLAGRTIENSGQAFLVRRYDGGGNSSWTHVESLNATGLSFTTLHVGDIHATPDDRLTVVYAGLGSTDARVALDFAPVFVRRTVLPATSRSEFGNALLTDGGLVVPGRRVRASGFGTARETVKLNVVRTVEWTDTSDPDVDVYSATCDGCMVTRPDGATLVLAHGAQQNAANQYVEVAAIDRGGQLLWQRRVSTLQQVPFGASSGRRIARSAAGVVAAVAPAETVPRQPLHLLRDDGTPVTTRPIDFLAADLVAIGNDFLLAGSLPGVGVVERIDGSGATVWRREFAPGFAAAFQGVRVDAQTGAIFAFGSRNGSFRGVVARYAADGTPAGSIDFTRELRDLLIAQSPTRMVAVLTGETGNDAELVQSLDAAGQPQWSFFTVGQSKLHALPDGDVLLADRVGPGFGSGRLTRLGPGGEVRWQRDFEGMGAPMPVLAAGGEVIEASAFPTRIRRIALDSGATLGDDDESDPLFAHGAPVAIAAVTGGVRILMSSEEPTGTVSASVLALDDRTSLLRDGFE